MAKVVFFFWFSFCSIEIVDCALFNSVFGCLLSQSREYVHTHTQKSFGILSRVFFFLLLEWEILFELILSLSLSRTHSHTDRFKLIETLKKRVERAFCLTVFLFSWRCIVWSSVSLCVCFYDSIFLLFIFFKFSQTANQMLWDAFPGGFYLMTMMVCIFFLSFSSYCSTDIFTDFLLHYIRGKLFNLPQLYSFSIPASTQKPYMSWQAALSYVKFPINLIWFLSLLIVNSISVCVCLEPSCLSRCISRMLEIDYRIIWGEGEKGPGKLTYRAQFSLWEQKVYSSWLLLFGLRRWK